MRVSIASFVAAVALVSKVSAEIFITEPTASTTCTAGTPCNVRWNDDANAPLLSNIGPCKVALYTGNSQQQTLLQTISDSLDVSTNSFVTYTPDATVGENGNMYFIRFESLTLKQTANPLFPYQSFSAKFTLAGMTGTFSPEVKAQISGAASTPVAAATTPATTPASTSTGLTTVTSAKAAATSAVSSASRAAATTSARSNSTNGAVSTVMPGVVGSLAGVTIATAMAGVMLGLVALGL